MSSNLLNNDNKTNYLFKKENFKSQTKLDGFSSNVTTRTYAQELYEGKSITLNNSIFGVDISKNIPFQVSVRALYDGSGNDPNPPNSLIPDVEDSEWPSSALLPEDQKIGSYKLSKLFPSLDYYEFYKRVYLEPVEAGNPSFWWLKKDATKLASPDNNLLSNMIPAGISFSNDNFTPIVEFYNSTTQLWQAQPGAEYSTNLSQNKVNWSIDYATGILTLNVTQQHLNGIKFTLDASTTAPVDSTKRPRISFMKYIGPLGAIGSGGGSGGSISDASYNDLVEDISQNTSDISTLDISLNKWLFAIPDAVTLVGDGYTVSTSIPPEITLSWRNPPQKCAAFDFYNVHTEIFGGNENLDQIYYATNNNNCGLKGANFDADIWNTITRSMNKLPFHERIVIQVKTYDTDSNGNITMIPNGDWRDLSGALVTNGSVGESTEYGGSQINNAIGRYSIFKDIETAVIVNDAGKQAVTRQQIGGDYTYRNTSCLDAQYQYRFRVALDNRSCDKMTSPHTWSPDKTERDISGILNWTEIPQDPNVYIELGNYGPGGAPTSIGFDPTPPFNKENYPSVSEIGTIKMEHSGVMDLSFNTAFNTNADILGEFGFDLSGSLLNSSVQLGSFNTSMQNQFEYCNKDTFIFTDVSYNTPLTNSNSHIVNVSSGVSNPGSWIIKPNIFSHNNRLEAYPQHVYDISGYYFMNNKFPDSAGPHFKAFALPNAYSTLNKETGFSNTQNTSIKIFNSSVNNNFLSDWGNVNEIFENTNEVPEYQIRLTNPPPNYPSASSNDTTKLADVRDVNGNQHYAIMIDSSGSILDISFNIASDYSTSLNSGTYGSVTNFADASVTNFITCPHGQGNNPSLTDVGESIYDTDTFKYSLTFNAYQGGSVMSPLPSVDTGNLYAWHGDTQNAKVPYPATFTEETSTPADPHSLNLTVVSDDAVGPVNNLPTVLQQKYGGYYNIHKIRHNTGIYNITTDGSGNSFQVDDISHNNYNPYSLVLAQSRDVATLLGSKTIRFNLGHVSTFDILPDSTVAQVNVSTINTQKLFGLSMPTGNIPLSLHFHIEDIYKWWTWPSGEHLMTFEIFYRYDKAATALGQTIMIDTAGVSNRQIEWNFPITGTQNHTYNPTIDVANTLSPLRSTYKYSRNGKEGDGSSGTLADGYDSQFFLRVTSKNNIYRTHSHFLNHFFSNQLYSSSSGGGSGGGGGPPIPPGPPCWPPPCPPASGHGLWDWGSATAKHILWWDYTYNGVSFASAGSLPEKLINNGSNYSKYKLKDPRGAKGTGPQNNSAYWLGGTYSTNLSGYSTDHEWYNNDYDHDHVSGPTTLEDNQLMWTNGSFKSGFLSGGTATNDENPYIDYSNYHKNTNDYSSKGTTGENWNYTFTNYDGEGNFTITDDYKFIVIEDSSEEWRGQTSGFQQFNGVEVYINGTKTAVNTGSGTTALTLGTDYIMYICGVGSFYNGKTNAKMFTDVNGNPIYRSGWMDCQRQLQSGTFGDGVGCFSPNSINNTGVIKYGFEINGLSTGFANIDKIFYRIGLKNDANQLNSGTFNSNGRKISSIKIKYGRL
tara:strand:+ start:4786 stop:9453 length:4668 start_codon:yes stop_codon:yes gene_type:complete